MAATAETMRAGTRRITRRRIKTLPIVLILAAGGGIGWWAWQNGHPPDELAGKLITAPVTKGDLQETISATGSVTAQTGAMVKIGSQITGRIKRLYADVGSTVKAGEVIAELDLPDIQAQLDQAHANLASSITKLAQQESGVSMQRTQTSSAVQQAEADLRSAYAKLASAQASYTLQTVQTPNDIRRAQAAVTTAQSALSTAKSNQAQTQASANLQISNAQEQLNQAVANEKNSSANLKRQQDLYKQGFVAASLVDSAQASNSVDQSLVTAARQSVQLIREKVTADLQSAKDQVAQATDNVESARAALTAAQAGTYQDKSRQADVQNARAQVGLAQAALRTARGNVAQDTLKMQDVQAARDAVKMAQAQVDYNKAQLDKTSIRSPITGTVLQLAAQQGETLAAGLSAPTLIIVADLKRLQVDAFVDETDIGKVRLGQDAEIRVDAFPRKVFKGHVIKVASGSTIQQGVVTYDVAVALDKTKQVLKPDMTASVTLHTGVRTGVLLVPAEAVKASGRGSSTITVATLKDRKQVLETRQVKVGASDGVSTEIRDGVKEGETVVLAGAPDPKKKQMGPSSPFGPSQNRPGGGAGGGRRG